MKEVININTLFVAEVAKQLKLRRMTQRQLAEAIEVNYQAVRHFMCGASGNKNVESAIARYLNIKVKPETEVNICH